MGGGEAVRYFQRHGGRCVSKAVLIASITSFLLKAADNPDGVHPSTYDEIARLLKADRPNLLANFTKQFLGGVLNFSVSNAMMD
jgi:non-heme chloroperoxidase